MKRILTLIVAVAIVSSSTVASAQITIAGWGGGTNHGENTNMDPSFAGTGVSGTVHNYISNASTAVNVTNYPNSTQGNNNANDFVGSLNFTNQLFDSAGTTAEGAAWGQFRIRNGDTLNPESGADEGIDGYTQLYWSDASSIQTVAGTTWSFSYSNNSQLGIVRAAVRDTNGDWFLSGSSLEDSDGQTYELDLGAETWEAYTPATASSNSLVTAPGTFTDTPGPINAYGFFLHDEAPGPNGRWRIQDFRVTVVLLGDANDDGVVNSFDIAAFGLALFEPLTYAAMYPGVDPDVQLDMNNDGVLNNFDIPGFGTALGF